MWPGLDPRGAVVAQTGSRESARAKKESCHLSAS